MAPVNTPVEFQDRIFSIPEAHQHLRVGRAFFYVLIGRGKITPFKLGSRTLITGAELARFVAEVASAPLVPRKRTPRSTA